MKKRVKKAFVDFSATDYDSLMFDLKQHWLTTVPRSTNQAMSVYNSNLQPLNVSKAMY